MSCFIRFKTFNFKVREHNSLKKKNTTQSMGCVFQSKNNHELQQEVSVVKGHDNRGFSFLKSYLFVCSHID